MTSGSDQRRSDRRPLETSVVLRVLSGELQGLSDNLSSVGMLLTTSENLRVEVELTVDGERLVKTGRLLRLDQLEPGSAGIAIEFDD